MSSQSISSPADYAKGLNPNQTDYEIDGNDTRSALVSQSSNSAIKPDGTKPNNTITQERQELQDRQISKDTHDLQRRLRLIVRRDGNFGDVVSELPSRRIVRRSKKRTDIINETIAANEAAGKEKWEGYKAETNPSRTMLKLPFDEYVQKVYVNHFSFDGANFEDGTRTDLWKFFAQLRAHPRLYDQKMPQPVFEAINSVISEWIDESGKPEKPWEHYFEITEDEADNEICTNMNRRNYIPMHDPLEQAMDRTKTMQVTLDPTIMAKRPRKYQTFVAMAWALQNIRGQDNIILPVKEVGELFGAKRNFGSDYIGYAKEDGYLIHQVPYVPRKKATEFKFNTSRFDAEERMIAGEPHVLILREKPRIAKAA